MDAVTKRRVLTFLAISLAAYVASLVLLGVAAGFDHSAGRWLAAAGTLALAVGLGASVMWRVSWFVLDPKSREWWWTQASWPARILRAFSLAIRAAGTLLVIDVVAKNFV